MNDKLDFDTIIDLWLYGHLETFLYMPFEATRAVVAAFVTPQVDRSNSLLVGAPKRLLDCLQSVLNAAARLLCNRRKYDHITPLLCDILHWLPVPIRIELKVYLL